MKTVTVEIPVADVAERYLKIGGAYYFALRQLNREPTDFHTLEVCDVHSPTGDVRVRFHLKNGPRSLRDVTLSLDDIFNVPAQLAAIDAKLDKLAGKA